MKKSLLVIMTAIVLAACGGDGGDGGESATATQGYVGRYDVCDDKGTEKVLTITESSPEVLTLNYVTNVYKNKDCSGEKTTFMDTPPTVTFKYRYTNTYDIYGFAAPGNWGTSSIDVGDSSSVISSNSVTGLVLDQGRLYYANRKTNAAGKQYFEVFEWYLLKGRL